MVCTVCGSRMVGGEGCWGRGVRCKCKCRMRCAVNVVHMTGIASVICHAGSLEVTGALGFWGRGRREEPDACRTNESCDFLTCSLP